MNNFQLRIPGKPVPLSRTGHGQFGGKYLAASSSQQIGRVVDAWERAGLKRFDDDLALDLTAVFLFARPASHYGTGRNAGVLKERCKRAQPTGRPDLDNLLKLICEALQGNAFKDDSRIVVLRGTKAYAPDDQPMTFVQIKPWAGFEVWP